MQTRKVVRVFLASPGDLVPERRAAKAVCEEFNSLYGSTFGYQVDLVGWEDTTSAFGRPQEIINRDLMQCEMFIGMLWKRWGTPPDLDGTHTSGFEEEYLIAVKRREEGGDLEICLFLKEIDEEAKRDPGDQMKLVLAFRENLIGEKKIYYEPFSEQREFETKLRRAISRYVLMRVETERLTARRLRCHRRKRRAAMSRLSPRKHITQAGSL